MPTTNRVRLIEDIQYHYKVCKVGKATIYVFKGGCYQTTHQWWHGDRCSGPNRFSYCLWKNAVISITHKSEEKAPSEWLVMDVSGQWMAGVDYPNTLRGIGLDMAVDRGLIPPRREWENAV